ncbi:MAG: methylisocitrate lyase [Verrucomicrobiae bacterium]|nr:methylisocitrate lyase [Verrucomicrobiae bacterium]
MRSKADAGARFRAALRRERPLQLVGTVHALAALQAEQAGFRAIYLSGSGVAACRGLPDLGWTSLDDVAEEARKIAARVSLPLLVDADTGWEESPGIPRSVGALEKAGVAGIHLEDQVSMKRCGHRPGKRLVPVRAMVERLRQATRARRSKNFFIIARTDAASVENVASALDRAKAYESAGADAIFAEALSSLGDYERFTRELRIPVLANLTEFGKTPLFSLDQMRKAGVRIVLYPLSAFRAMNAAASEVYREIRRRGTQRSSLRSMQTRAELYDLLEYRRYEKEADRRLTRRGGKR